MTAHRSDKPNILFVSPSANLRREIAIVARILDVSCTVTDGIPNEANGAGLYDAIFADLDGLCIYGPKATRDLSKTFMPAQLIVATQYAVSGFLEQLNKAGATEIISSSQLTRDVLRRLEPLCKSKTNPFEMDKRLYASSRPRMA